MSDTGFRSRASALGARVFVAVLVFVAPILTIIALLAIGLNEALWEFLRRRRRNQHPGSVCLGPGLGGHHAVVRRRHRLSDDVDRPAPRTAPHRAEQATGIAVVGSGKRDEKEYAARRALARALPNHGRRPDPRRPRPRHQGRPRQPGVDHQAVPALVAFHQAAVLRPLAVDRWPRTLPRRWPRLFVHLPAVLGHRARGSRTDLLRRPAGEQRTSHPVCPGGLCLRRGDDRVELDHRLRRGCQDKGPGHGRSAAARGLWQRRRGAGRHTRVRRPPSGWAG